jgi:uncharacterized protein YsxB (DUF464 family)
MIRVRIERDSMGRILGFEANGHAGAGSRGNDIVCAAVSVLTDSVFLGLDKHLHRAMEWSAERGDISVRLKEAPDDLTEAILTTLVLGLTEIQKIYPDRLRIL